jgi:hypothetical protein
MDEIAAGVPIFGSLPVDHNPDYRESKVIFNGEAWRDRCAFLLIYGSVAPRFYTGNIGEGKLFPAEGTITASKGNMIQSVNEKPAIEYLLSLGLTKNENGEIEGINSFPLIADFKDGAEPVVTSMYAMTPEGYAVCGRKMPVGATLSIGRYFPEEIVSTSASTLDKALDDAQCHTLLIFSCVGRCFSLMYDQSAEMEMVVARIENRGLTYMMAYSGGEVCPVRKGDAELLNRAHSNTFIVCAF